MVHHLFGELLAVNAGANEVAKEFDAWIALPGREVNDQLAANVRVIAGIANRIKAAAAKGQQPDKRKAGDATLGGSRAMPGWDVG
mmetsp:Transcript_28424/g.61100  ORF Transcript_28424/g.61100 Transcript_28424/m.61100 type:complete len:85 (+) Transcript_28424:108-362(+)